MDDKKPADDVKLLDPETAPTPTPAKHKGVPAPTWVGRSIAHEDHAKGLEMDAAMNEFGHKMPRAQAEEEAHKKYVENQHVEAAAHHLAGIKAAHGAGDMEAARKHGLMYNLHSKALGTDPVGPAHPSVVSSMEKTPAKVYKFKAHRGDLFALESEGNGGEEKTEKAEEALYTIYAACEALTKAEKKPKAKVVPCVCKAYQFPHRHTSGKCGGEKK